MEKDKQKSSNPEKVQERLEESNHVILKFTIIYYFALLIASLVQYIRCEESVWKLGVIVGLLGVLLCQMILFFRLRHGIGYGWMSLLMFSIVFTYINGTSDYSMVLMLILPMMTWGILYMDRRILIVMDIIWAVNAIFRFIWMISSPETTRQSYNILITVLGICIFFGISAHMVNTVMSHYYKELCDDLKKNNRMHNQLYKKSVLDTTTNLMNRNAYNEYLKKYDEQLLKSVCCIYIDVNGLHEYNNTYGHQAGDNMLTIVANEIKQCFEGHGQYRVGGDEFVVICQNVTFKEVLYKLKKFRTSMKKRGIHVATGLEWRDEDMNIDEIIREADAKMYQDKELFYTEYPEGREGASIYSEKII